MLNVEIDRIFRTSDAVKIVRRTGKIQQFDKVVFATPPDQVMALLAAPTDAEIKRFAAWKANYATTLLHTDSSIYNRYGIKQPSEFDFFQAKSRWGYNSCLNQICDISSPPNYFLSFQLEELIASDSVRGASRREALLQAERIIHIQKHHTPLYTTESFQYQDEVIATNGENNTYHAGAYLGDGLCKLPTPIWSTKCGVGFVPDFTTSRKQTKLSFQQASNPRNFRVVYGNPQSCNV